jgi:hypothetical protein
MHVDETRRDNAARDIDLGFPASGEVHPDLADPAIARAHIGKIARAARAVDDGAAA